MSAGFKRKRDGAGGPKFYAVRVGRQPGIFASWSECFASVNAFPKAIYKSFSTEADAKLFLTGVDKTAAPRPIKPSSAWYAVRKGHQPGVYPTWDDAKAQVTGYRDAIYRKFASKQEAEQFLQAQSAPESAVQDDTPAAKKLKSAKVKSARPEQLHADDIDLNAYAPGDAPLAIGTEDGFDSSIILDEDSGALRYRTDQENAQIRSQVARPVDNAPITIYTDGSTLANGSDRAIAGVGVYFGPLDKRNASETLPGKKQTNQRAELTAIMRALELAPWNRRLIIKTDSKYAIECVTNWFLNWQRNNWQTAQRKTVDNKDLIVKIIDLLDERMRNNAHRKYSEPERTGPVQPWDRGPASVRFDWVKGHSIHEGNQAADTLAVQGAQKARELDAMTEDVIDI